VTVTVKMNAYDSSADAGKKTILGVGLGALLAPTRGARSLPGLRLVHVAEASCD
jgi:hypothetical protein